jgi:flagellar biosynthesis protein FliP
VKTKWIWAAFAAILLVVPAAAWSQGIPMVNVTGSGKDAQYSLSLQLLALMTTLTLLPSLLLMMTSFVRIIIVMSILRQALGTGQTPPNNVLVGISLFLTLFIMSPVLTDVYTNAQQLGEQIAIGLIKCISNIFCNKEYISKCLSFTFTSYTNCFVKFVFKFVSIDIVKLTA